jgi:hypothetical protein
VVVSAQADTSTDVITIDVYGPDGTVVADSGSELSATPGIVLRDPAPGTYSVRVEALLGTGPVTYDATASAVDAGEEPAPEQPCNGDDAGLGPPPQEVLQAALDDDGRRVQLDVLVLLDGVDPAYAAQFFEVVAKPYDELAIDVVPTFETVPDGTFVGVNSTDLIGQTQDLFPDRRVPVEYDIVELLTHRDIEALGQTAVAGQAKCIGGIAFDEHAFNVSEAQQTSDPGGIVLGPLTLIPQQAAKITAHEMGHLMGGQHHLANCVEGALPGGVLDDDSSPCSLMFNSADFIALRFGTVNAEIIRGYALLHATANDGATPTDPTEPPDGGGPPEGKGVPTGRGGPPDGKGRPNDDPAPTDEDIAVTGSLASTSRPIDPTSAGVTAAIVALIAGAAASVRRRHRTTSG